MWRTHAHEGSAVTPRNRHSYARAKAPQAMADRHAAPVEPPVLTHLTPSAELTVLQAQVGPWANLNHLLVCTASRRGVLVDPFDGPLWHRWVDQHDVHLQAILLTHSHWDHVKGVADLLASRPELEVWVHEAELQRGWTGPDTHRWTHAATTATRYEVGHLSFDVLASPGHTPGHITLLGHGIVLSGDCLFLGRCGRVDLLGGDLAAMYASLMELRRRLEALPADWLVLPGHRYALEDGREPDSLSIGEVLASNPALRAASLDAFSTLPFLAFDDEMAEAARRARVR